jgi:methylthioribose-1-phosphate isomerase
MLTFLPTGDNILTHCNTGALATPGMGTALGVIREAHRRGLKIHVYVDETRPLLQGGRLTTYELQKEKIPYTLICDNMAATLMRQGKIQRIFVGADRIAINGDFANKIGKCNHVSNHSINTYFVICIEYHIVANSVIHREVRCNFASFRTMSRSLLWISNNILK